MHIDNAETDLWFESMANARLKLDTERAELEARKAVAEATLASSGQRLHDLSRTAQTPPTYPKSSCGAVMGLSALEGPGLGLSGAAQTNRCC